MKKIDIKKKKKKKEKKRNDCKFSSLNTVEDECHFLLECTTFEQERLTLFDAIKNNCLHFNYLDKEHRFIWILSCEDKYVCERVASFTYKCFELRKKS